MTRLEKLREKYDFFRHYGNRIWTHDFGDTGYGFVSWVSYEWEGTKITFVLKNGEPINAEYRI